MFTGIIQELGTVRGISPLGKGTRLDISASSVLDGAEIGDSIALNGVCLTVVGMTTNAFQAEAVEETMLKTALGDLRAGHSVNLEAALRADGKLGGHFVQGHVDFTTTISETVRRQESWLFSFELPTEYDANVIPMGSVAIDGVSLTVAEKSAGRFTVSVIPHTFEHTRFRGYRMGSRVNIELDMIGKYVLSYMKAGKKGIGLTASGLEAMGY